jgi:magnesium transporter
VIRSYATNAGKLVSADGGSAGPSPDAVWYDLVAPTREEELSVGALLGVELPTREDREEIEVSSRLYAEEGVLFMTVLVPAQTDGDRPVMAPVAFVLADGRLVTIRDHEPRAFQTFVKRAERLAIGCTDGPSTLLGLADEIVDRIADVLERVARDIDTLSHKVFGHEGEAQRKGHGYVDVLKEIGRKGDLASKIRDSLVTLERMASFLEGHSRAKPGLKKHRDQIKSLGTDTRALSDHADFLGQKTYFLLDATLGLIQIEQNGIIKIFSVVAVVFLPPTLVASMYGMNFEYMPELAWPWGYPFAIGLMILSAILPYLLFKRKGWL